MSLIVTSATPAMRNIQPPERSEKFMSRHKSPSEHEADVACWNAAHNVGRDVTVLMDSGEKKTTKTRSEAWLMGGHTAVIMLEGISGCYALERVLPV